MGKNLIDILEEDGIKLQKSGVRFVAKCPFHGGGERTPPFTIYPNETYFCFSCRVWGDAVKYLVDKRGMSPDEAMDYVGEEYRAVKRKQVIKIRDKGKVWPLLYEIADAYNKNIQETPGALNYLEGRGLSRETIAKYKIGYTDGRILNLTALEVQLAIEYGLMNEKGWETMSHRITIPNIPEEGACDFIMGRTVTNEKIRYLGTRTPKTIYGLADAWNSSIMFLTEGHMDWLVLREWGYPSIVVGGTHIHPTNIAVLKQRKIVIVPDNDVEGIKAGVSLKGQLGANSMILDYADLGVKDVGELAEKGGRNDFKKLVLEQVRWPLNISSQTLLRSFPILADITNLQLT